MSKRNSIGTPGGRSKKNKSSFGEKQVLASPFAPNFPKPSPESSKVTLNALQTAISHPFASRSLRSSQRKKRKNSITNKDNDEDSVAKSQENDTAISCAKPSGLLVGVNEVTRALEKNNVAIAVVCRDITSSILVAHLPILCFTKEAKMVVLPGDGTNVGAILGTKRCLAFAVKRSLSEDMPCASLRTLTEKLSTVTSKLDFPWLVPYKDENVPSLPEPTFIPHRGKKERENAPKSELESAS